MTDWLPKYEALDADDKKAVDAIIDIVLNTIAGKDGAVVMLTDTLGTGRAEFLYGGNALLVAPLLRAGGAIGVQYFEATKGTMQ